MQSYVLCHPTGILPTWWSVSHAGHIGPHQSSRQSAGGQSLHCVTDVTCQKALPHSQPHPATIRLHDASHICEGYQMQGSEFRCQSLAQPLPMYMPNQHRRGLFIHSLLPCRYHMKGQCATFCGLTQTTGQLHHSKHCDVAERRRHTSLTAYARASVLPLPLPSVP